MSISNKSKNSPIVTCVIPTFRRPEMLARAIDSVLNQTFKHISVAVCDNASGDDTKRVVEYFRKQDDRIVYHCHAENIGLVKNFNFAMGCVETPYFSILNDDDVLLPKFYEIAMGLFDQHADAMFAVTESPCVSSDGDILSSPLSMWEREGYFSPPEGVFAMFGMNHPNINGTLFRREILDSCGYFDERVHCSDLDLYLRAAAIHPFVVTRKPGSLYVSHGGSSGQNKRLAQIWPAIKIIIGRVTSDERISRDVQRKINDYLVDVLAMTCRGLALAGSVDRRFDDAGKAIDVLAGFANRPKLAWALRIFHDICRRSETARSLLAHLYHSLTNAYDHSHTQKTNEFAKFLKFKELKLS